MTLHDPLNWLPSAQRVLEEYTLAQIDESVIASGNPSGLEVYEVVFDWPDAAAMAKEAKLPKTIIHFAIDDIDNNRVGLGRNYTKETEVDNAEPAGDTITYSEAMFHELNFDVGVWASDQSGGVTSRLVVYQTLHNMFGTEIARRKTRAATDVEILRFNGGRFITDRINDLRVFRIIDCELVTRVSSRTDDLPLTIIDKESVVNGQYEIDGTPIT
jgi:hypothetical protein